MQQQHTHPEPRRTVLPRVCPVCDGALDKNGRCTQLKKAEYMLTLRGTPCGCYVCTVAGGDCARVGLIADAPAFIDEHRRAHRG